MLNIEPFIAAFPQLEKVSGTAKFWDRVKEEFSEFWQKGFFKKSTRPAFYIYRQSFHTTSYTGLIAMADIRDYQSGNIIRHEQTLDVKRKKMIDLIIRREAHIKPTLITYPKVEAMEAFMADKMASTAPFLHVNIKSVDHHLWQVDQKDDIQFLTWIFKEKVNHCYIRWPSPDGSDLYPVPEKPKAIRG